MLKIVHKWKETAKSLLQKSLENVDRHMRKRLMAVYFIAEGETAKNVAEKVECNRATVSTWVHNFNEHGIDGLTSKWSGRPGKILTDQELDALKEAVRHHPRDIGLKRGRWTAKTVAAYIKKTFKKKVHPDTARKYLHFLDFSYKTPRKNLLKADPQQQEDFARKLEQLEKARTPRSLSVYLDEGKIEQDALPRKGWFQKGVPAEIDSSSPGKKKILFYGAVIRPSGQVITMQVDRFNQKNTAKFIAKIRKKLPGYRIDLIMDNAPWHNGRLVQKALSVNRIREHRLPPYSPKMNACEYFIRWAKSVLSYNWCWKNLEALKFSFRGFVASLARIPQEVLKTCKPEMLGFSIV